VAVTAAVLALPSPAFAQAHDHSPMSAPAPAATATVAKAAPAEGEVRKVDTSKGTVVLKHGPLTALNMPAMTMEFVAKDPKTLAGVKEGDKVRFTPQLAKDGKLVVTSLEVVKN
jgi:Cu/Ag efflux protein CusF